MVARDAISDSFTRPFIHNPFMDIIDIVRLNLLSPMVLCFALGLVATFARSQDARPLRIGCVRVRQVVQGCHQKLEPPSRVLGPFGQLRQPTGRIARRRPRAIKRLGHVIDLCGQNRDRAAHAVFEGRESRELARQNIAVESRPDRTAAQENVSNQLHSCLLVDHEFSHEQVTHPPLARDKLDAPQHL